MTPTTVSRLKAILSGSQFDSVMRILGDDQPPAPSIHAPEPAEKYWQDCHFVATLVGPNSEMKEFYCHTMLNPGTKSAYIDFLKDCSNYFYEKYKCDSTVIFTDVIKP